MNVLWNHTTGGSSSNSNSKNMEESIICVKEYVWDKDNPTYNMENYECMRMDAMPLWPNGL